ncbi:LVIVD repeat-containing protein [Persicimonas caeni]|uniref:hypothetical protein n=1 Tax=Persicimonas caeni TaxID=2292766 RepID=UPI00143D43D5|nr:hypothetical protein [Persicimonas caeni]
MAFFSLIQVVIALTTSVGCSDANSPMSRDGGFETDAKAQPDDTWQIPDPFAEVDRAPLDEDLHERKRFLGAVASSGSHAFAVSVSLEDRVDYRLLVYDIDGDSPRLVGKALTSNQPTDIVVADGLAYLVTNATGIDEPSLIIYDVTNPAEPRWYGKASLSGIDPSGNDCLDERSSPELHLQVLEEHAYIGCSFGIAVVDISEPSEPEVSDVVSMPAHVLRLGAFLREWDGRAQHLVLPLLNGNSEVPVYLVNDGELREMAPPLTLDFELSSGTRLATHIPPTLGQIDYSHVNVAFSGRGGALALSEVVAYSSDDKYTPESYTATDLSFTGLLSAVAVEEDQVYVATEPGGTLTVPTVHRVSFSALRDPTVEGEVELEQLKTIYDLVVSADRIIIAAEAQSGDGLSLIPVDAL